MKKTILLSAIILFSTLCNSQSFNGVSVSGTLNSAIEKFKQKGFVLQKYVTNGVFLKGNVASLYDIELYIITTPKTKSVCKFVIYLEPTNSWHAIKGQYNNFAKIFSDKYGEPDSNLEDFLYPYEEGDGSEMTAIAIEKCIYASYWMSRDNASVGVEISKFKQVKIVYENDAAMEFQKSEIESMEGSTF